METYKEAHKETPIPDISSCEREPIHLIGSVQPHGALIAFSEPGLKVLQASANARTFLRRQDEIVGHLIESLFSDSSMTAILKALSIHQGADIWPAEQILLTVREAELCLEGTLHRYNGICVLELEPEAARCSEDLLVLRHWISKGIPQLFRSLKLPELLNLAAMEVQATCGFDRVLIYQFDKEWHGTVVAEQKREFMPSFVNQRFPASDIPAQARALYTKKLLRILADVDAVSCPLEPAINSLTGQPLDLTYSVLRSMSAVHVEYMRNMGVSASMSISLIVRGKLWGLIACHNKTPKNVDFTTRSKCELLGAVISGLIEKADELELAEGKLLLVAKLEKIVSKLSQNKSLTHALGLWLPDMVALTNANGIALYNSGIVEVYGTDLEAETVRSLCSWLSSTFKEQIFCSDRLSLDYPQWQNIAVQVSGLIAINISTSEPIWILWLRPERIEEVQWAGNPNKPIEADSEIATIQPRKSFAVWAEVMRGRSEPWRSFEIDTAASLQGHIIRQMFAESLRTEKIRSVLQQQREDVLAILTHDLNVVVVAMERLIDPLVADQSSEASEGVWAMLKVLKRANSKLRSRINKLSQVLNYELGQVGITAREIDCAELMRHLEGKVTLMHEQFDVKLFTTINQSVPGFRSDLESMERLLLNLTENAILAAGRGGIVEVICLCSSSELNIQVKDDGPGILPDDKAVIFQRFWQGGINRSYSPHVGMGLYFCKRIVETLKGTIRCESTPGQGTSFIVILPCL
jgi:light-regulated signal transduction histidine kinase (bacteriophytochrome)